MSVMAPQGSRLSCHSTLESCTAADPQTEPNLETIPWEELEGCNTRAEKCFWVQCQKLLVFLNRLVQSES